MIKRKNSLVFSMMCISFLFGVPQVSANSSISNFLDGFRYEAETKNGKERIVAIKARPATNESSDNYIISFDLEDFNGDKFAGVVGAQSVGPDVDKQTIINMFSMSLQGQSKSSKVRIEYDLSKSELIGLYGEKSLLVEAMSRCHLDSIRLRIEVDGEKYRFISPQHTQALTYDTLHRLAFCG